MLLIAAPLADSAEITRISLSHFADKSRMVLELSAPSNYEAFSLSNPVRFVLDLQATKLGTVLPEGHPRSPLIKGIRAGVPHRGVLRLVLDLNTLTN